MLIVAESPFGFFVLYATFYLIFYDNIQPYCSTGEVFNGYNFGWCGPECVMHEDSFTWRKDATVKITLQYNNAALLTRLEWYGIILTCLLLYSLILTAFLSAIGTLFVTISN